MVRCWLQASGGADLLQGLGNSWPRGEISCRVSFDKVNNAKCANIIVLTQRELPAISDSVHMLLIEGNLG